MTDFHEQNATISQYCGSCESFSDGFLGDGSLNTSAYAVHMAYSEFGSTPDITLC